ncbi:MAG: alpha/beta hydrolase [Leptospiraceae bacterium]|nr:alpha/beta hydrolase [Leptospiraceae bacterium]
MNYVISEDGTKIAYYQYGKGDAIFIFNGFSCSEQNIFEIVQKLSKKYRVIFFDYKGHGNSGSPKVLDDVTLESAVKDAKKIFDLLKIKKAHLIGYSTGVQVMLEFHAQNSKIARSLVCISGFSEKVLDSFLNTKTKFFSYITPKLNILTKKFRKPFESGWKLVHSLPFELRLFVAAKIFLNEKKTKKAVVQPFLDSLKNLDPSLLVHFIVDVNNHKLSKPIEGIKIPTLVMCGEKDLFAPIEKSKEIHEKIKHSKFLQIPNASHNVVQEEPELIASTILKFLNKITKKVVAKKKVNA